MLTYHGKATIKAAVVQRVKAHYVADEIVQGLYWREGKGCCVGCITHQNNQDDAIAVLKDKYGWPEWLGYLGEKIFEGLPNKKAKEFPLRLVKAIPVGVDIDIVKDEFLLWLLKNEPSFDREAYPNVDTAIQGVIALYERTEPVTDDEWSAWEAQAKEAAEAAWSAARSAQAAARSVQAVAWSAWAAAEAAQAAAWSAAWAAAWAAAEAAWSAYERQADKLIELLEGMVDDL